MNNIIRKLALAFVGAAIVALLIVFGIYKKNQAAHDAYIRSQHLFRYVAASKVIPAGQKIDASDLMTVNWTSDQPVIGAFGQADKGKLLGRVAVYPIEDGMLITNKLLSGPNSFFGLAQKIPNGMRAVAIKTDEVKDFDGFLFPGSKVDVMATMHAIGARGPHTVMVAQDVLVLTTGKQMTPDPSGKATEVTVVAVLVNPDDAEKIAMAQAQGDIYFALRNGDDQDLVADQSAELTDLAGVPNERPTRKPQPARTMARKRLNSSPEFPSPGSTVVTILGDQKEYSQQFRGGLPVDAPTQRRGANPAVPVPQPQPQEKN